MKSKKDLRQRMSEIIYTKPSLDKKALHLKKSAAEILELLNGKGKRH